MEKELKKYYVKEYQVIFVDEYDNYTELGTYRNLKDAEPDVNAQLENYILDEEDDTAPGETPQFGADSNMGSLVECAGTMGPVFDRVIPVAEGCVQVRGFIKERLNVSALLKDISDKLIEQGHKFDALAHEAKDPIMKSIFVKGAYEAFGKADAYKNVSELLKSPDDINAVALLNILRDKED